jgi:hypothetical protein
METISSELALAEWRRRAVLLELGLIAYRLEHGKYPLSPSELVGNTLSRVPTDPLALEIRDFRYHPQGLDGWLAPHSRVGQALPPGTPFFWSGALDQVQLFREEGANRVAVEIDEQGEATLWRDLEGRPLYHLNEYGDGSLVLVSVLPLPEGVVDEKRSGRAPEVDGVPVSPWTFGPTGGYGMGRYGGGYGPAPGRPYSFGGYGIAPGGYGGGFAPYGSPEQEGLPPGYDLPPIDSRAR